MYIYFLLKIDACFSQIRAKIKGKPYEGHVRTKYYSVASDCHNISDIEQVRIERMFTIFQ